MSLILSIDTATPAGSVALHESGRLIGLHEYHVEKSHSSLLHKLIEQLLENCQINQSQLDAIAVSSGPGSYTGLRIGISSAKGLCYALDVPLISVNTLLSMAHQVAKKNSEDALLCPMIDARRLEVYSMLVDKNMKVINETAAVIIDENSYSEELGNSKILFFGDGSEKCKAIIQNSNACFIDDVFPSAADIGDLAHGKFESQQFENLAYYEPFYLKEFRIIESKKKYF